MTESDPDASSGEDRLLALIKQYTAPVEPSFNTLFDTSIEFPYAYLGGQDILPLGVCYENLPPEFLDVFLRIAGEPLAGFVLAACHAWDEVLDEPISVVVRFPGNGFCVREEFATKAAAYAILTEENRLYEFKTNWLRDDTLLLHRHHPGIYWYFWYHMSGRCDIGRFRSDLATEDLLTMFKGHAERVNRRGGLTEGDVAIRPLPLHVLRINTGF